MGGDPLRTLTLLLVAANVGLALWLLFRRDARWAMLAWAIALFFTPVYLTFSVQGIALTVLDVVTILALAASLPAERLRWSVVDTVVVAAFACLFAGLAFGAVPGHVQYSVMSWLLPYAWGRVVVAAVGMDWVATCIGGAAVLAAALAIIEFITGVNLFVLIPGVQGAMWTGLQLRGGLLRAEGAFGHSISLGSSLAISTAFLLAAPWRLRWKVTAFTIVLIGTIMTFSRIGLIGVVIVVMLSTLLLGKYIRRSQRLVVGLITLVGAIIALPIITQVFDDAGDEAAGSAEYRADLVPLIREMNWLGISPARELAPTGIDYYAGYRSIDSALILTGLRHGMVPLLILLGALAICAWVVFTGRGSPAAVAVLSQVPAIATVALITQYAQFLWFAAGVAVASYTLDVSRNKAAPQPATGHRRRDLLGAL